MDILNSSSGIRVQINIPIWAAVQCRTGQSSLGILLRQPPPHVYLWEKNLNIPIQRFRERKSNPQNLVQLEVSLSLNVPRQRQAFTKSYLPKSFRSLQNMSPVMPTTSFLGTKIKRKKVLRGCLV